MISLTATSSIASTMSPAISFPLPVVTTSLLAITFFRIGSPLTMIAPFVLVSGLFRQLNTVPVAIFSGSLRLFVFAAAFPAPRPALLSFQGGNPCDLFLAALLLFQVLLLFFAMFVSLVLFVLLFMILVFFGFLDFSVSSSFILLLHSMSVQLKQLHCIKLCEVRHKEPKVAAPFTSLVVRHWRQEKIYVTTNLHQAPPCVGHLFLRTLVRVRLVQGLQGLLHLSHFLLALSKYHRFQLRLENDFSGPNVDRSLWCLRLFLFLFLPVFLLFFSSFSLLPR